MTDWLLGDEDDELEVRAERLRVLIAAIGEEPTMRAGECFGSGLVPGGYGYYIDDDPKDCDEFGLAWEFALVAQDLRARQYRSLERLLGLVGERAGTLDERIRALPDDDLHNALAAIVDLEWISR